MLEVINLSNKVEERLSCDILLIELSLDWNNRLTKTERMDSINCSYIYDDFGYVFNCIEAICNKVFDVNTSYFIEGSVTKLEKRI